MKALWWAEGCIGAAMDWNSACSTFCSSEGRKELAWDWFHSPEGIYRAGTQKILQTSKMILCAMVSKVASTKQLLLGPFPGWNCFSVHPYMCVLICTEVFAEGRAVLVIPNSIYPIQTAANPCLSFRTVLRVRSEQSQGNNVWSFFKSLFWQTVAGQCKTVPCSFSLDVRWNAARIVPVQCQIHRRGTELIWPLCVWGTNILRISTSCPALLDEALSLSCFHMQKLEGFESDGLV